MRKLLFGILLLNITTLAFAENVESENITESDKCLVGLHVKGNTFNKSRGDAIRKASVQALTEKGYTLKKSGPVNLYVEIDVCPAIFGACDHLYVDQHFSEDQMQGASTGILKDITIEGLAASASSTIDYLVWECGETLADRLKENE